MESAAGRAVQITQPAGHFGLPRRLCDFEKGRNRKRSMRGFGMGEELCAQAVCFLACSSLFALSTFSMATKTVMITVMMVGIQRYMKLIMEMAPSVCSVAWPT